MLAMLALLACVEEEEEDGTAPDLDTGDAGDCDKHAPVIESVSGEPGNPIPTEGGGEVAGMRVTVEVSDEDGDLDITWAEFWLETPVDGRVDATVTPAFSTPPDKAEGDPQPCGVPGLTSYIGLPVTGSQLKFDTVYDIGVVFYDHHDVGSELFVGEGLTPSPI